MNPCVRHHRLTVPTLDFWVDVTVVIGRGGVLASAEIGGDREIGLSASVKGAVRQSLIPLGNEAAEALIAGWKEWP